MILEPDVLSASPMSVVLHSEKGLVLKTTAQVSFYSGQVTFSTQLTKPHNLLVLSVRNIYTGKVVILLFWTGQLLSQIVD